MPLSIHEVEHLAQLARLQLASTGQGRYVEQLGVVLEYINLMNGLEAVKISRDTHTLLLQSVLGGHSE